MGAREQVFVFGAGVVDPTGEGLGDEVPGGVAVGLTEGDGFGVPMVTDPRGWGEGRVPTAGLGLVVGTSTCPSFLHAGAIARSAKAATARDRAISALLARVIGP